MAQFTKDLRRHFKTWLTPLMITTSSATWAQSSIPERREFPVNPKIDPCEDFYAYACSETIGGFQLRPDRAKHTFAFDDSAERLLVRKNEKLIAGLR